MAILHNISGRHIVLRAVTENDAQFTLDIRNNPLLTEFIPKINISLEEQKNWINKQRQSEDDYFFIIENNKQEPLGTIAFYNKNNNYKQYEVGRWISYGSALENTEAVILIIEHIFNVEQFNSIVLHNHKDNKKVNNFWKRFGAYFNKDVAFSDWVSSEYILTKDNYLKKRNSIFMLL